MKNATIDMLLGPAVATAALHLARQHKLMYYHFDSDWSDAAPWTSEARYHLEAAIALEHASTALAPFRWVPSETACVEASPAWRALHGPVGPEDH